MLSKINYTDRIDINTKQTKSSFLHFPLNSPVSVPDEYGVNKLRSGGILGRILSDAIKIIINIALRYLALLIWHHNSAHAIALVCYNCLRCKHHVAYTQILSIEMYCVRPFES